MRDTKVGLETDVYKAKAVLAEVKRAKDERGRNAFRKMRVTKRYKCRLISNGMKLTAFDPGRIEPCLEASGLKWGAFSSQVAARLKKAAAGDRDHLLLLLGAARQAAAISDASRIGEQHVAQAVRTLGDLGEVAANRPNTAGLPATAQAEKPTTAWDVLTRPSDVRYIARAQHEQQRRRLINMAAIGAVCTLGGAAVVSAFLFDVPQTMVAAAVEIERHVSGSFPREQAVTRLESAASVHASTTKIGSASFAPGVGYHAEPQPVLVVVEDGPPSSTLLERPPYEAAPAGKNSEGEASGRTSSASFADQLVHATMVPLSAPETPISSSAAAPAESPPASMRPIKLTPTTSATLVTTPGPTVETTLSNLVQERPPPSAPQRLNATDVEAVRTDLDGLSAQSEPAACRHRSRDAGARKCRHSRHRRH